MCFFPQIRHPPLSSHWTGKQSHHLSCTWARCRAVIRGIRCNPTGPAHSRAIHRHAITAGRPGIPDSNRCRGDQLQPRSANLLAGSCERLQPRCSGIAILGVRGECTSGQHTEQRSLFTRPCRSRCTQGLVHHRLRPITRKDAPSPSGWEAAACTCVHAGVWHEVGDSRAVRQGFRTQPLGVPPTPILDARRPDNLQAAGRWILQQIRQDLAGMREWNQTPACCCHLRCTSPPTESDGKSVQFALHAVAHACLCESTEPGGHFPPVHGPIHGQELAQRPG